MKTDELSNLTCYEFKASEVSDSNGALKKFQIRYEVALVLLGEEKRPELVFCLDNGEMFRPNCCQLPISFSSAEEDGISAEGLFSGQCVETILGPVLGQNAMPFTVSKVLEENVPSFKLIESSLEVRGLGKFRDGSPENHFCFLVKGTVYKKK